MYESVAKLPSGEVTVAKLPCDEATGNPPLRRFDPLGSMYSGTIFSVVVTRVPCTKDSNSTRVLNENYGLGLESSTRTRTQIQVG